MVHDRGIELMSVNEESVDAKNEEKEEIVDGDGSTLIRSGRDIPSLTPPEIAQSSVCLVVMIHEYLL